MNILMDTKRDKTTFWCPECGNKVSFSNKPVSIFGPADGYIMDAVDIHYEVRCPNCDEYMLDLDFEIADFVIEANKAGYETMFSCEGHEYCGFEVKDPESYDYDKHEICNSPYVSFKNNIKNEELKGHIESMLAKRNNDHIIFELIPYDEKWTIRADFEYKQEFLDFLELISNTLFNTEGG